MSQASAVQSQVRKTESLFFSVFDANGDHIILEFDYQSFSLHSWFEGVKIVSLSFNQIKKAQTDNATIVIQYSGSTPPSHFHSISESHCRTMVSIFNQIIEHIIEIINPSTNFIVQSCLDAKPKICIRMVEVSQKSFKIGKIKGLKKVKKPKHPKTKEKSEKGGKRSINFVILTDNSLILLEDRNAAIPIAVLPLDPIEFSESSDDREFSIKCNNIKGSFQCKNADDRALFLDAAHLSRSVVPEEAKELSMVVNQMKSFYNTKFDKENPHHVEFLKRLWDASNLNVEGEKHFTFELKTDRWKALGFQRDDPVSDLRATGMLGLQNLVYFAEQYNSIFLRMAGSQQQSSDMEYPFCTAGINLTFLLIELLDLKQYEDWFPNFNTHPLFFYKKNAWEDLYSIIFRLFDQKWSQMKLGYMGFQKVIDTTRENIQDLLNKRSVMEVPAIFDMMGIFLEDLKTFRSTSTKAKSLLDLKVPGSNILQLNRLSAPAPLVAIDSSVSSSSSSSSSSQGLSSSNSTGSVPSSSVSMTSNQETSISGSPESQRFVKGGVPEESKRRKIFSSILSRGK